ncbi:MAG TPA: bifunctional 3,4-dihydroxy-2-butanone-4-phosphate synthase/GTP cyclohydrolase II [Pseudomonadales bacterium]|nr:bifunctional 3,4-dihydroxy-2-butanone-4-phosphate synthase/GTP cyclohydrolase II [Pseudomonadales bacterium]
MNLNSVEELIEDIRRGKMIILMDDEDRENEGDIVMAASMVRAEDINFMAKYARGLICLTLSPERCAQLKLPLMVERNGASHGTNFTLSIEAAEGVTTGISAADRAHTVRVAVARDAKPEDIVQPGHIFPLMARPGGVLHRAGHTEAGCDLARLAGLEPAAVIVEIMNDDGTMARRPDLEKFAEEHGIKIGTIADLIHYRTLHEKTVEKVREEILPTVHGEFKLVVFKDRLDGSVHTALVKGDVANHAAPLVRVHVADPLRDLMMAKKDGKTGWSLPEALSRAAKEEAAVVLLLGISFEKMEIETRIEEYFGRSQRLLKDETSMRYRTIGTGSQILKQLGINKMRIMSSPMRFRALSGFDLEIVEYVVHGKD